MRSGPRSPRSWRHGRTSPPEPSTVHDEAPGCSSKGAGGFVVRIYSVCSGAELRWITRTGLRRRGSPAREDTVLEAIFWDAGCPTTVRPHCSTRPPPTSAGEGGTRTSCATPPSPTSERLVPAGHCRAPARSREAAYARALGIVLAGSGAYQNHYRFRQPGVRAPPPSRRARRAIGARRGVALCSWCPRLTGYRLRLNATSTATAMMMIAPLSTPCQ